MANALGFDLGQVYRDAESIKSARLNRQINSFNHERQRKTAEAQDKIAARNGEYKARIASGDPDALREFAVLAPEEAANIIENYDKLDASAKQRMEESVEMQGQVAAIIRRSPNPAAEYSKVRSMLPPELAAQMPEQYDPSYVELQLARAMDMDKLLEGYKVIEHGDQDLLQDNTGNIVDRTTSGAERGRQVTERNSQRSNATSRANAQLSADTSRSNALLAAETSRENNKRTTETSTNNALLNSQGGDSGMKAADENAMYRQSVELLGGLFDAQGNIQGLDPSIRSKVQAIATEATRIYKSGGVSRTEAVSKAADKYGVNIPQSGGNAAGADNNDPLGLFK